MTLLYIYYKYKHFLSYTMYNLKNTFLYLNRKQSSMKGKYLFVDVTIDYVWIVRKLPTQVKNFTNFLQCRRYQCCVLKNLPPMSLVRYPKCTVWSGTCDKGENMILLQVWTNAWCAPIVGMFIDNRKCFVNILHTANEAGENVMSILVLF